MNGFMIVLQHWDAKVAQEKKVKTMPDYIKMNIQCAKQGLVDPKSAVEWQKAHRVYVKVGENAQVKRLAPPTSYGSSCIPVVKRWVDWKERKADPETRYGLVARPSTPVGHLMSDPKPIQVNFFNFHDSHWSILPKRTGKRKRTSLQGFILLSRLQKTQKHCLKCLDFNKRLQRSIVIGPKNKI
jgi:hypothetical protein